MQISAGMSRILYIGISGPVSTESLFGHNMPAFGSLTQFEQSNEELTVRGHVTECGQRPPTDLVTVMVAIEVAFAVTIGVMVVSDPAAIAIPVAVIEKRSIMTRLHPMCAGVRRAGPVSRVPLIAVAYRVPVAPYKGIAGAGTWRLNPNYTRPRRRADSHSDGKLREDRSRCQQHQHKQFSFHNSTPLRLLGHVVSQKAHRTL
jgi:hypothetical protein